MTFPTPTPGASLLLSFRSTPAHPQSILFISSHTSTLTSQRIFSALEASFKPLLATSEKDISNLELESRVASGQVDRVDFAQISLEAGEGEWDAWFTAFEQVKRVETCRFVAMNDSVGTTEEGSRTESSAIAFSKVARRRRYQINVADRPDLSDFTFPVTHRFPLDSTSTPSSSTSSGTPANAPSPLQLALTTNSSACRLSLRIKREIVAALPTNIGHAVLAVGNLRKELKELSKLESVSGERDGERDEDWEATMVGCEFNKAVPQLSREMSRGLEEGLKTIEEAGGEGRGRRGSTCRARRASRGSLNGDAEERRARSLSASASSSKSSTTVPSSSSRAPSSSTSAATTNATWSATEAHRTRMRYVAQISEYWPLDRLASINLSTLSSSAPSTPLPNALPSSSRHDLLPIIIDSDVPSPKKQGRIFLLGTGPGSPLLLTRLAYLFLTSPKSSPYHVDVFLSDKLVPPEILALIPAARRSEVVIAKKYPGNAEHAQDELMRLAVEAAKEGKTVLRMKQGDPFLYGRGGEEVLHFRKHGFESTVIPGLSSCLAGPAIVNIPVTQRGVAESVVVCTGVGRGGREVVVDGYSRTKTLVVLMGVARLHSLIPALVNHPTSSYPSYLPIALIERASSPDQRVIMATLETIIDVLGRLSAHRPPGMLVIGWSVLALEGEGDMKVIDEEKLGEERDRERVQEWLGGEGYRVREGLGEGWRMFKEDADEL